MLHPELARQQRQNAFFKALFKKRLAEIGFSRSDIEKADVFVVQNDITEYVVVSIRGTWIDAWINEDDGEVEIDTTALSDVNARNLSVLDQVLFSTKAIEQTHGCDGTVN